MRADTDPFVRGIGQVELKLQEQIAAVGKSAAEMDLWRLKQAGATDEALRHARALTVLAAATQAAHQKQQQMAAAGKAVFTQTRTSAEQYGARMDHLRGLLASGAISQETYGRATLRARSAMEASAASAGKAAGGIGLLSRAFIAMAVAHQAYRAIKAVADPALEAEHAMVGLRKATDLTPAGVADLKGQLQQLSVTMKGVKLEDLYSIATTGAKLGIASGDLIAYSEGIAKIAMAMDDVPAAEIADEVGKINVVFGLGVKGAQQLGSAIDKVADSGVSSAKGILDVTQRISGAAAASRIAAPEAIALAGALLDTGTQAELAGTTIQRLLMSLNKAGAREGFAATLGVSAKKFGAMVEDSPIKAIQAFLAALDKMDAAAQQVALGDIGIKSVLATGEIRKLAHQSDRLADYIAKANDEFATLNQIGSNTAMVAETTGAALEQASNHAKILADALGTMLLPVINAGTARFGKFAEAMEGVAKGLERMKALGWAEWLTTGVGASAFAGGIGSSMQLTPKAGGAAAAVKAKLTKGKGAGGDDEDDGPLSKKELKSQAREAADAFKELGDRATKAFESTRTPAEKLQTQLQELNALWAVGAIDVVTFSRAMADARKEFAKDSGAAKLIEDAKTPVEKFREEMEKIDKLQGEGLVTADVAGRGRAAALTALRDAGKGAGAGPKFGSALELGSAEARSLVLNARTGSGTGDPIKDVARESKQQTALAKESVALQRQLLAKSGGGGIAVVTL